MLITARVAKVMFSQACLSKSGGRWATPKVNHPPPPGPAHHTSLPPPCPGPRSRYTSLPLGPGHNTLPPSGTRSQHLPPPPGPGHNTSLPLPGTRSQHLPPPGPGHNTPPPRTMHRRAVRILLECIFVFY